MEKCLSVSLNYSAGTLIIDDLVDVKQIKIRSPRQERHSDGQRYGELSLVWNHDVTTRLYRSPAVYGTYGTDGLIETWKVPHGWRVGKGIYILGFVTILHRDQVGASQRFNRFDVSNIIGCKV